MLMSMTGYGRSRQTVGKKDITVEIKSVNHRYLDSTVKVARTFGFLEEKIKSSLQSIISRGKVDVYVGITFSEDDNIEVKYNRALAEGYLKALYEIKDSFSLKDDISIMSLSRFGDIFSVDKTEVDEDELWQSVKVVFDGAADAFLQMRRREGESLYNDLRERYSSILAILEDIEVRSPQIKEEYFEKMQKRLSELLAEVPVNEDRLLNEAAIYADKIAIDEETVRLRSHLEQYISLLEGDQPVGRKLDFLVQEMNREINTIGSKNNDIEIARKVIDLKSEIEKIREQIQNIE